jgi:hypothetical protein
MRKVIFYFIIYFILSCYPPQALAQDTDTKVLSLSVSIEPVLALRVSSEGENIVFRRAEIERGQTSRTVQLSVINNTGAPYKIFLEASGPLDNSRGTELSLDYLKFTVSGTKRGRSEVPSAVALSLGEQLIYSSNAKGEGDNLTITFSLEPKFKMIPAGRYVSNISYRIVTQ